MTAPTLPKRQLQWRKWLLTGIMVLGLIWSIGITNANLGCFLRISVNSLSFLPKWRMLTGVTLITQSIR